MSEEAKEYIKSKHNGEIPYQYGANECAKLMQAYADEGIKPVKMEMERWKHLYQVEFNKRNWNK